MLNYLKYKFDVIGLLLLKNMCLNVDHAFTAWWKKFGARDAEHDFNNLYISVFWFLCFEYRLYITICTHID